MLIHNKFEQELQLPIYEKATTSVQGRTALLKPQFSKAVCVRKGCITLEATTASAAPLQCLHRVLGTPSLTHCPNSTTSPNPKASNLEPIANAASDHIWGLVY